MLPDEHEPSQGSASAEQIDFERRRFLLTLTSLMGGAGVIYASIPFLTAWSPSERAEAAGAPVEVDLSNLQPGEQTTVEWRGKPVWIIRRSHSDLARLREHDDRLRDPHSATDQQPEYVDKKHRSIKPEYLILIGICTHLGCSPVYRPYLTEFGDDWPGGFFCPCHGSTFDMAGRVFKGVPAPINLEVPPHVFLNDHTVLIGTDEDQPSL